MSNACRLLAVSIFIMGVTIAPAYAYLDPGTGSIILQGVIAAVAGGLFVARSYLFRVKLWLRFGEKQSNDEPRAK